MRMPPDHAPLDAYPWPDDDGREPLGVPAAVLLAVGVAVAKAVAWAVGWFVRH